MYENSILNSESSDNFHSNESTRDINTQNKYTYI